MKKSVILSALGVCVLLSGCDKSNVNLDNKLEKQSYAIGYRIGKDFKNQDIALAPAAIKKGIHDALNDSGAFSDEEIQVILQEYGKEQQEKRLAARKAASEKNKSEGQSFLLKNKSEKDIRVTPSGLQFKVLSDGAGKEFPKATSTVTVHYRGTLIDGTEFDSSYKRNRPATFRVDRVIKGWTEALQKMKKGSKWMLYIPPDLAYGENGAGQLIGPNATLVFEVELIDIKN